ncbi:MAG: hypothetical protein ABH880_01515 [Patescibacteria group bacterium]
MTATTTAGDPKVFDNAYFKRRILGFRSEMEFEAAMQARDDIEFFEGGQFFITDKLQSDHYTRTFVYTTISDSDPESYKEIYTKIASWKEMSFLYFARPSQDNWNETSIMVKKEKGGEKIEGTILRPNFKLYKFNKEGGDFEEIDGGESGFDEMLNHFEKPQRDPNVYHLRARELFDYFSEYDLEVLKKVYATRYLMDVVMRKAKGKITIDVDGFIKKDDRYYMIETKEKSPIVDTKGDQNKWKFGWDTRRVLWYLHMEPKVEIGIIYVIREIDNRTDRNFQQWLAIKLDDFLKISSWGNIVGGGGGEDTVTAPYIHFQKLEDLIGSL